MFKIFHFDYFRFVKEGDVIAQFDQICEVRIKLHVTF